jgi:hypothetical protein
MEYTGNPRVPLWACPVWFPAIAALVKGGIFSKKTQKPGRLTKILLYLDKNQKIRYFTKQN